MIQKYHPPPVEDEVSKARRTGSKKEQAGEKLQKAIARLGLGSRRQAESWISNSQVLVNNQIAHLGQRVRYNDLIQLKNSPKQYRVDILLEREILLYHKPVGEICSKSDPERRPTVYDNLPKPKQGKWISIGRLDYNTSGLLVFTNDGEYANSLMHPSKQIEREYRVRVLGQVENSHLEKIRMGLKNEGDYLKAKSIERLEKPNNRANQWFNVVLIQGHNREIKRLFECQGFQVNRLIRVRYGAYVLPRDLKPSQYILV